MYIVDPDAPGSSYMMYKLLTGTGPDGSPFQASPDEIQRLRNDVVVGMPMPPQRPFAQTFDMKGIQQISDWIAEGAPVPATCPAPNFTCP
jgi:hypothetical protein